MLPKSVYYERVSGVLDRLVAGVGLFCFFVLVFVLGFPLGERAQAAFGYALYTIALVFVLQELLRMLFAPHLLDHVKSRKIEVFFIFLIGLSLLIDEFVEHVLHLPIDTQGLRKIALGSLALTQLAVFALHGIRWFRTVGLFSRFELTPSRLMVVSFLLPILAGTVLLKLPNATTAGISWIDALFTATSAICVTGLSTVDPATAFTPLGQAIIGLLIQIGGLGIMTITMSFGILFSSGLAVKERMLFSELLAEERLGQVGHLLVQVTFFTLLTELVGAVALYLSLDVRGGFDLPLFLNSVFHSVSAFCNAGFSLFTDGLYDQSVRHNTVYSAVVMGLIVAGGLGYPVFYNLFCVARDKFTKTRGARTLIKSPTKMVLASTAILLVAGTGLIFLSEDSFGEMSRAEQLRQSLFLSVTSRTAGFNIWPTNALTYETSLVLIFLMWVGGSPMSTAGGIKTLTLAIAWLNLTATLKGARRVVVFGRQIAGESFQKAHAIIFGSILILAGASLLLIVFEPGKNKFDLVFEAVSAFGTVGLSRGVTGALSAEGKLLVIVLMFVGRLGFVTVLNSFYRKYRQPPYRVLKESIPIS